MVTPRWWAPAAIRLCISPLSMRTREQSPAVWHHYWVDALDVTELYERHREFVGRSLERFGIPEADRSDQVHEVFIVVLRRLHTYRGDASIRTWLFAIARRVAAGYRRRGYRVREEVSEEVDLQPAEDVAVGAERVLIRHQLNEILAGMHASHRDTLLMADVFGLTRKQIAEKMGCRVPTVGSRLHRAREHARARVLLAAC